MLISPVMFLVIKTNGLMHHFLCRVLKLTWLKYAGLLCMCIHVCVCVCVWVHLVASYCTVDILFPMLKSAWKCSVVFQRWEEIDGHQLPARTKKKKSSSQARLFIYANSAQKISWNTGKLRPGLWFSGWGNCLHHCIPSVLVCL